MIGSFALLVLLLQAGPAQAAPEPSHERRPWDVERSFCLRMHYGEPLSRPAWLPEEEPAAMDAVWDRRWSVSTLCAYEAAARWAARDPEKAVELYWTGRARSQYDHARYRKWPADVMSSVYAGFGMAAGGEVGEALKDKTKVRTIARRVFADHRLFASEYDDLEPLCESAGGIRPKRQWKAQAERLRREALASLNKGVHPGKANP